MSMRRPGTSNLLLCTTDYVWDTNCRYYKGATPYDTTDWTGNEVIATSTENMDNLDFHAFFDATDNTRGGVVHNADSNAALDIRVTRFTVTDTAIESGRNLLTGIPLQARIPPLADVPPMDLAKWESELDYRLGRRASRGKLDFLVDGEQFFPVLRKASGEREIVRGVIAAEDREIANVDRERDDTQESTRRHGGVVYWCRNGNAPPLGRCALEHCRHVCRTDVLR